MDLLMRVLAVPVVVQRSPEWYAKRRTRITASEAASVLGENPYETATDVLFKKFGLGKPFTGNIATRYGQQHEPTAIAAYCAALGRASFEVGLIDYESVHGPCPELHFVAGSPDGITVRFAPTPCDGPVAEPCPGTARAAGFIGPCGARPAPYLTEAAVEAVLGTRDVEPVMLEVKCPFRRRIVHGQIPKQYYAQVQLNMLICGMERADFVEFRPKPFELNIVRCYPDKQWLARSIPVMQAFYAECARYAHEGIHTHPAYAKYAPKPDTATLATEDVMNTS
jgi:putative phage-type endonuclease